MDRYAVLGRPAAHSQSPRIQQAFARQFGHELSYEKIEVGPEQLGRELARLHAEGYQGLNITLPHKLAALAAAAEKTPRAEIAGAANVLIRLEQGWRADNSDGEGLIRDLRNNLGLTLAGKKILLLGSGGAARGILKPLLDEKPAQLTISSRTPWKVEKIAAAFAKFGLVTPRTHLALKGDRYDLLINATSAGHEGQVPRLPQGLIEGGVCYDLSYGHAFEPFRTWAQTQNAARVADGLGMLVEQAAVSFELWRGQRPKTAPVLAQLRAS